MFRRQLLFILCSLWSLSLFSQNNYSYNVKLRNHTTYPGQTLANICGYWQNGNEYALLGASKGMIVVDVTNPDKPTQITQLPGPDNLWKEIKVYKHYAYVTSEGGQGLQCVDLSALPSATLTNQFYTGDGAIAGKLGKIHALHIDTLSGVVYCFGATGVSNSGATMLDIKTDPMNPKYLGSVNKDYIHDGYAHNDTLYAGHIYRGEMEIWYTKDKANPVSLGKIQTPTKFTHNIWLSENHRYAYTTDENNDSVLAAYDVSDPANIKLMDKIATNPGSGAVVHNTHILNDFAVSSYYTEGFTIVDAHKPDNLVEVGRYDTYDPPINVADPFDGAWGVYPYFPSGTIVVSNIGEGLFVFSPTYKRAAYLEGTVKSKSSKQLLSNVDVKINKYVTADALTTLKGIYKTGVVDSGTVTVTFTKGGYKPLTTTAVVDNGVVTILDVELEPFQQYSMTVVVKDATSGALIKDANVSFVSATQSINQLTNSNGEAAFTTYADTASVFVGKWGYSIAQEDNIFFNNALVKTYTIKKGYRDDFISAMPLGWTATNTSPTGLWVIGEPITTQNGGQLVTPSEDDTKDLGTECYLTGNESGQPGASDVDDGSVTLTSPAMDLTTYKNPTINFDYWFYNGGGNGGAINDSLYMVIDNGTLTKKVLIAKGTGLNKWNVYNKTFKTLGIVPTAKTTVSFIAVDETPGHLVKAALDKFEILESPVGVVDINENIAVQVAPNPFAHSININYQLDNSENATLILTDITGKVLEKTKLNSNTGTINVGENLQNGLYFIQIQQSNSVSKAIKIVKQL